MEQHQEIGDMYDGLHENSRVQERVAELERRTDVLAREIIGDRRTGLSQDYLETLCRLQRLATTDELTELSNYAEFVRILDEEVTLADQYDHSLHLIIIDLDGFKGYNDRFGHQEGDQVLRCFGNAVKTTTRKTDRAFRYTKGDTPKLAKAEIGFRRGGDEFAIILRGSKEDGPVKVTERLRSLWPETYNLENIPESPLGFSAGVASYESGDTAKSLESKADRAVYGSKAKGGYVTTFFNEMGLC